LQAPEELELLVETHRLQHRQCRVRRSVRDDSRLRLAIDPVHQSLCGPPVALAGGGERNLDDFAIVLFDGDSHPVEGHALAPFPGEIWRTPRSWVEASYTNVIYFNEVAKGDHFAAWEEPGIFSQELRAASSRFAEGGPLEHSRRDHKRDPSVPR
jgi:hypothetical protein